MKHLPKNHFDLTALGLAKFAEVTDIWSNHGFWTKFFVANKAEYEELTSTLDSLADLDFTIDFVTKAPKIGYRVDATLSIKNTDE